MIEERDNSVAMRDGTRLAVDVYRPDAPGKYPVLYASALRLLGHPTRLVRRCGQLMTRSRARISVGAEPGAGGASPEQS